MSKDQLHAVAKKDVSITDLPNTWPAIIVWAITKFGVGALFPCLLVWVYADLKEANNRNAKLIEANIAGFSALVQRIDKSHDAVGTMQDTIRRIESAIGAK